MRHVERSANGDVIAAYENPQFHPDGSLRTEEIDASANDVKKFLHEMEKRTTQSLAGKIKTDKIKS